MTVPQTATSDSSPASNGVNGAWPVEVLAFAAEHQVQRCLQPLWEATQRIFPTARFVKVQMDDDPEIRDDRHILYNVQAAGLSLDESRAARTLWIQELLRICAPINACIFRLRLDLKR